MNRNGASIMAPVMAVGLMSGTSMDGIDAAVVTTDGVRVADIGPALIVPYDPVLRRRLKAALAGDGDDELERDLTFANGAAVKKLLIENGLEEADIAVIGFHGQTVFHDPANGITRQLGDGALLADETAIPVVNDFRSADVAAGGEGAPLAPLYHAALAASSVLSCGLERPLSVLNIGGVANVTWLGEDDGDIMAFDCGPGNALIDDWTARTIGRAMDEGGRLARGGTADRNLLAEFMGDFYFAQAPPKSLDRNAFAAALSRLDEASLSPADGAATLSTFTVRAVVKAAGHFPAKAGCWVVTGGGRLNGWIMEELAAALGGPVMAAEEAGWRGDFLEAEAFAFLAVRSIIGLPLSLPATTGVGEPTTGGVLHLPPGD